MAGTAIKNYPTAAAIYAVLFLAFAFPYWGLGMVVAPDRQYAALGTADSSGAHAIENYKFSDFDSGFVPEITAHMSGKRSGWLALWTNENELGRPLAHLSGFSPAYPPTWLLFQIVDSPRRLITILSLSYCFLAGGFILLWCRETGLTPLSGLIAGSILATPPLFVYWLTFPMFPAVWCWSAGSLLGCQLLYRGGRPLGWALLAFCGYSALLTAYPQPVVFNVYILGGYGIVLLLRRWRDGGWRSSLAFVVGVTSALFTAILCALPVYLDLVRLTAESARVAPDTSFFLSVLPSFDSLWSFARFVALSTAPQLFGNPIDPAFPFPYDGVSVPPLVLFLAVLAFCCSLRSTWGWWVAIAVTCAFAFYRPLSELGIKYLGFNLSRSTPLGSILLPLTLIAAYGADALERRTRVISPFVIVLAASSVLLALVPGLVIAAGEGRTPSVEIVAAHVVIFVALLLQLRRIFALPMLAIVALSLAVFTFPLQLRQNPDSIATTSRLVSDIEQKLPPGARYAVATPGLSVLQPNVNATVGLASLHSYNSLSSRRFMGLIDALGGEVLTYGRWNGAIAPDYSSTAFWMSNIGLMLADRELADPNLRYLGPSGTVHLHAVQSRMGCCMQLVGVAAAADGSDLALGDPRRGILHAPIVTRDDGDLLEIGGLDLRESLLVLSKKYHRDWHARVLTPAGWSSEPTISINGVFLGVPLPADTIALELRFEPFARFAWTAHLLWLAIIPIVGLVELRRIRTSLQHKEIARN